MRVAEQLTRRVFAIAAATWLAVGATARAQAHDHMAMTDRESSAFSIGASLLAADFGPTPYYVGDYEGVIPTIAWSHGPVFASAMIGAYRLDANGRIVHGVSDAMLATGGLLVDDGGLRAGGSIAATLPTGDDVVGLGMGHVMAMPSLWAERALGPVAVRASAGYSRGITGLGGHVHGLWPLVEPMNLQELAWRVAATVPVWQRLELAASTSGGVPFGVAMGVTYATSAVRAAWVGAGVTTACELQIGWLGDPYIVRGVVEAMVRL